MFNNHNNPMSNNHNNPNNNHYNQNNTNDKTIIDKTQILSKNTNLPQPSLPIHIQTFKDYQVIDSLEIFSNFSDLFLLTKDRKKYILKLYKKGLKLDTLVLSKLKNIKSNLIANIVEYGYDVELKRDYIIEEYYELG